MTYATVLSSSPVDNEKMVLNEVFFDTTDLKGQALAAARQALKPGYFFKLIVLPMKITIYAWQMDANGVITETT